MKIKIIFKDAIESKEIEVSNVYTKEKMLCIRYGDMLVKYPLDIVAKVICSNQEHKECKIDAEIIFMDNASPIKVKISDEYNKGEMLCVRLENEIVMYPLKNIFSMSHLHGPHIGSRAHYDKYMNNKENNK